MNRIELIRVFAETHPLACVVTDAASAPGPHMLYVNPAFIRLSGYSGSELQGRSPCLLQGKGTERSAALHLRRGVDAGHRVRVVITNYRKSGEPYLCEIVIHPIRGDEGELAHFIAFEREVHRRRGRPPSDRGRFQPADTSLVVFDAIFRND